jgi:nitrate reductase delta subunit
MLDALFRYPDPSLVETARRFDDEEVKAFAAEMASLDLPSQQSTYTSTFDLAPSCTPYLGIHLFGDENPDRARLMVGLRLAYQRVGMAPDPVELPDHVAEVLRFAARDDVSEREDLRRFVLVPALQKMSDLLAPTANPYRHLVAAALHRAGASS